MRGMARALRALIKYLGKPYLPHGADRRQSHPLGVIAIGWGQDY